MKIIRLSACVITLSLIVPSHAGSDIKPDTTAWEKLAFRFSTELLRNGVNKGSRAVIGEDKLKVGIVTVTEAGDLTEYSLVAFSKSGKDRNHELLARLATNTLWHLAEPVLKKFIHDKDTWKNTELLVRTAAKYVIYFVIEPHIPK